MKSIKFMTSGLGLWSTVKKKVSILSIDEFGKELRVYFNSEEWSLKKDGLIYTDPLFLEMLKVHLKNNSKSYYNKVDYSERGMQGDDYVSFDI
jgi:hypothetical protein